MNTTSLFSQEELLAFTAKVKQVLNDAAKSPIILVKAALSLLILIIVASIEWEMIFQVFFFLVGDSNNYWSPSLMACSAFSIIIGFHLLAISQPDNLAIRFVDKSVGILIPSYLAGMGLLVACILYVTGLGAILEPDVTLGFSSFQVEEQRGVLSLFFEKVTNPIAIIVFCVGMGGLAIVNIFVAHKLIEILSNCIKEFFEKVRNAKMALTDHKIILNAHKSYADLCYQQQELEIYDYNYLSLSIAGEALSTINEKLEPNKIALKNIENALPPTRFEEGDGIDAKQLSKDIAKIEAINMGVILKNIKSPRKENENDA